MRCPRYCGASTARQRVKRIEDAEASFNNNIMSCCCLCRCVCVCVCVCELAVIMPRFLPRCLPLPLSTDTRRNRLPVNSSHNKATAMPCSSVWLLWPPYEIGGPLYFCPVVTIFLSFFLSFFLSIFFSSPNLSGRRLDVYHTSTHGVALVRI